MLKITIDGLPCIALTDELCLILAGMGEDVSQLNKLTWPIGAANPARGTFLMYSTDAATLAGGTRARPLAIQFLDDSLPTASGQFNTPAMYQVEHRPVHIAMPNGAAIIAVTLVDSRAFWGGVLTTTPFNVTTTTDRTAYYDETKNTGTAWTWAGILTQLAGLLGITLDVSAVTGAGDPTDYLLNNEPVAITIDRICAALGYVFSAGINGTYAIVLPYALNAAALTHNTTFLRERMNGGTIRDATTPDGLAWLDTVMPSSVTVRFPRQIPSGADAHDAANPPPLRQFYTLSSGNGKPSGSTGRAGYIAVVNDTLWAIGPIGAETNATALRNRADAIAAAYYARYAIVLHQVRLMGFVNVGPIAGTVSWQFAANGPFTTLHTTDDIGGGTLDVGEGFNAKNVIGLGGIQTHRTFDGSLIISGGVGGTSSSGVSFLINGTATGTGLYTALSRQADTGGNLTTAAAILGTFATASDCLVLNLLEQSGFSASGHDVTSTMNSFSLYGCGSLIATNSDGTKIVLATLPFTAC